MAARWIYFLFYLTEPNVGIDYDGGGGGDDENVMTRFMMLHKQDLHNMYRLPSISRRVKSRDLFQNKFGPYLKKTVNHLPEEETVHKYRTPRHCKYFFHEVKLLMRERYICCSSSVVSQYLWVPYTLPKRYICPVSLYFYISHIF
jgi:hypothetical protein